MYRGLHPTKRQIASQVAKFPPAALWSSRGRIELNPPDIASRPMYPSDGQSKTSACLINAAGSTGRRNTCAKFTRWSLVSFFDAECSLLRWSFFQKSMSWAMPPTFDRDGELRSMPDCAGAGWKILSSAFDVFVLGAGPTGVQCDTIAKGDNSARVSGHSFPGHQDPY